MEGIFKMVKKDLDMKSMIRLNEDNFNDFFNLTVKEIKTYKELKSLFEKYDLDINNVYFTFDHMYQTWYIEDICYFNLQHLSCLEQMSLKNIKSYKSYLQKHIDDNDWEGLMILINDAFAVDFFINNYEKMPTDQVCQILCNLYTSREYVLEKLDIDIIKKIFNGFCVSEIPSDEFNDDGYINIYRGQTYASTPIERALSWSLDKDVAEWFANRFKSNGKIYKGKVKKKDILLYTNDRNEQEVLVEFKKVKYLEEI